VAFAETFAAAHRGADLRLDYSLASLEVEIDRVIKLPIFNRGGESAAGEQDELALTGLCASIGESLRRLFQGEWVGAFSATSWLENFYRSTVRFGEFEFNPHGFIGYRLSNGPEEGTFQGYLEDLLPLVAARQPRGDPFFHGAEPNFDTGIIRRIATTGGARELHDMLLSISKYCVSALAWKGPVSREDGLLTTLAIHHLDFVARHGVGLKEAVAPKGYVETSHEEEFEQWLKRGAPGLVWEDVLGYLRDHPLSC
jgi:hypothetical protein